MLADLSPVEEAVRAWAAVAGIHVDQLVLDRRGRPVLILPLVGARPDNAQQDVQVEVIRLLRDAGKPLAGTLILAERDRKLEAARESRRQQRQAARRAALDGQPAVPTT